MLTWLAPWWLYGLAGAVAAPLVAHLLSRRGGVLAGFPAVRFVEQAVADVAKVQRPRHWLLLLLRIAALALIVLAFADPRWLTAAPVTGDAGLRLGIVVDNSASMQRSDGGVTLFDRARGDAAKMLQSLDPSRDRAVVVLAGRSPKTLLAEASGNFSQLAVELASAEPTLERGDLELALDLAGHSLESAGAGPMRLALFTDAQRTVYPAAAIERWRARGVDVTVHTLGKAQPNVAVHDARVMPSQPVVGQPVLFSAQVRSYADEQRTVTLRCGAQSQRLVLQPGHDVDAIFEVRFDQPGPTAIGVALESADALEADNTAGRVVDVAAARPVTVVTRGDTMEPVGAVYYTVRGLSPSPDGRDEGVALQVASTDQLASRPPEPGAVWVLVEAGAISGAARYAMTRHVEAGGGVLWIVDSPDAADSAATWPIAPIASVGWMDGDLATLAVGRFDNPMLAVFEGPGRSMLLDHTFARHARGALAPQADALLIAADGTPLLATSWHGSGRVAMFAADLAPASTGLVKAPAWPALLHQLVRHLAPGSPPGPPLYPGDTLPDGTIARTTGRIDTPTGPAWVELHPDESDLHVTEDASHHVTETAQAASTQLRPDEKELWPWLMLLGLALLAGETLTTWVIDPAAASTGGGSDDV